MAIPAWKIEKNSRRTLRMSGRGSAPDFALKVNGKEQPYTCITYDSPYEGWCVQAEAKDEIGSFSVNEDTVSGEEVWKHTDHTSIVFLLEGTGFSRVKRKLICSGWIAVKNSEHIAFKIHDDREKEVKCYVTLTPLKKDGKTVKAEDGILTAFTVTCHIDEKMDYNLLIESETDASEVRVFTHLPEPEIISLMRKVGRHLNRRDVHKVLISLKENGINGTKEKARHAAYIVSYYHDWFLKHRVTYEEWQQEKKTEIVNGPKISLIVPTYNTPVSLLKEMMDSVLVQSYGNWELCIADGSDPAHPARKVIERYTAYDPRIKAVYLDQNYGISGNTNKALELVTGDYTAMYDHDDFIEPDALYEIAEAISKEHCDIVYTDEDKYSSKEQRFEDPNLKPDFSIDLLRSHNYITHLFVVKTYILRSAGGFHSEYDGSQDYDVILRCIEKTDRIYHLSKILYHWRRHAGSTAEHPESKMYCYEAGQRAIQDHLSRIGIDGKVEMMPSPYWGLYHVTYTVKDDPLVSVIIPNYENLDVLKRCINSLFAVNSYSNLEIIIVENNSKSEEIFAYYQKLQEEHDNVHVVTWEGKEFNYSSINNYGEKYAHGKYLLFLNNDTEVINPSSIAEMVGTCQREDVGIVGAKLLYANNTVQHAGVVIGIGDVAGHISHGIDQNAPGFMMTAVISCDYSAVTAACMMVKKELFEKVNGFDEELAVAFNDIDLCLKIRELNKLVVYNAFSLWHHYESISRGYEETPEKKARFARESKLFHDRWLKYMDNHDPYYNKNFDVHYTPFELH